MKQAYDVQELIERVRARGGPEAEKLVAGNIEEFMKWMEESAILSENKIDDYAVPMAISTLKPLVAKVVDQIDGKVAA